MKNILLSLLLISAFTCSGQKAKQTDFADYTIRAEEVIGLNTEFWKAAGSDHLFYHVTRPSGQALLDRMESSGSHRYLRTHHTFMQDYKKGVPRGQRVYSEDAQGKPSYDFSAVKRVFAEYVKRGIKPIVEYDYLPEELEMKEDTKTQGNDEGMLMRNTGPSDWGKWSDLMKAATRNFIDTFGEEEVRTWYFEVWNEPDGWPLEELDVFFRMYDVFVDAVHSVDPKLRVGGPACYHEHFLRPFLNHVAKGTNFVTGEKGTHIDFISYHIYGLSGKWLDTEPYIHPQVQHFSQSVIWLKRLLREFPELKGTEFHINEWGLSSHYYRTVEDHPDLVYRNNIESALFLAKLVNSLYQIEDNHNFPISMLLYWGFSWEADEDEFFAGKRELSTAGNIPKPIQSGFEMLAMLEEQRIGVVRNGRDYHRGILATRSSEKDLAILAYNYLEEDPDPGWPDSIRVEIQDLRKNASYAVKVTSMDKENNNTYAAWKKLGEPESSKGIDLGPLLEAAKLKATSTYYLKSDKKGQLKVDLSLPHHSMQVIQIVAR